MTERQIQKELSRQTTLLKENCKLGNLSTEKSTSEKYAAYVLELKQRISLKVRTLEGYKELLRCINNEIGSLKLQNIRPEHLNRLYAKLAEPGQNKKTGQSLSPKTTRERHRVISTISAWAVKEQLVLSNTATRAMPPKIPRHDIQDFEVEEL